MSNPGKSGYWRRQIMASLAGTMLIGTFPSLAHAQEMVIVAHAAGINGQAVEKLLKEYTAETGMPKD